MEYTSAYQTSLMIEDQNQNVLIAGSKLTKRSLLNTTAFVGVYMNLHEQILLFLLEICLEIMLKDFWFVSSPSPN